MAGATRSTLITFAVGIGYALLHHQAFPNMELGPPEYFTAGLIGGGVALVVELAIKRFGKTAPPAAPGAPAAPAPEKQS